MPAVPPPLPRKAGLPDTQLTKDQAEAAVHTPSSPSETSQKSCLPATSPRTKANTALAEAPAGMGKLQAMAWYRRREHKRRAMLKVRALIFMTGARGLAAAEVNGGIVPRAVLRDTPDAGDKEISPKPRVIARLEAKRGTPARRRWMKLRGIVFMLGAQALGEKIRNAERTSKLGPPAVLNAKERIRWRARSKLQAVFTISGAAGLQGPVDPPDSLSPMEKLKWKAARKQQSELSVSKDTCNGGSDFVDDRKQQSEHRASEHLTHGGSDGVDDSDFFQLQPVRETAAVHFCDGTRAQSHSPAPEVLQRVLGVQHSPSAQRQPDSLRLRPELQGNQTQPELAGVLSADDDHAGLHGGIYGRALKRLEMTTGDVNFSMAQQPNSPSGGPGSPEHYRATSSFLASHQRQRSVSRLSTQRPRSPSLTMRAGAAKSPSRPATRSPVRQYRQLQQQTGLLRSPRRSHRQVQQQAGWVGSPRCSPIERSAVGMLQHAKQTSDLVGGVVEVGAYRSGLGMVSERIATLQMARAVLATRNDMEGLSHLIQVENELRETQVAIQLARDQLGRTRRSRPR